MLDFRRCFQESGALVPGHFVFTSGRHSDLYVNKDVVLVHASHAVAFAERIVSWITEELGDIHAIVGPESGAVPLMAHVQTALWRSGGMQAEIFGVRALKTPGGGFAIGKGQERFLKGGRAVIVEDIASTGESARKAVNAVERAGGVPIGVSFLWNRGGVSAYDLGVRQVFSLVEDELVSYPAIECPLCAKGVPINTELGHGKEFLARA